MGNNDIIREALARVIRESPAGFARVASGGRWELAPHLELINEKLLQVVNGEISRLMVLMPPRNGKSEEISKYFPAWYLGMFPDRKVILTSYEADFAAQWGRRARDLLDLYGEVFPIPVKVRGDSSAANRWELEKHGGGMMTAGVRGPITGKGMHLGIVDDPVKNAEEANSQTIRDHIWEWYKSTFYTRLEPGGAIILVMTRWHEDDLGGRLLDEMKSGAGDRWEIIRLPAIAEEDDQLGRQEGEPLWPSRFPLNELMRIQRVVGPYDWAALYQQRPSSEKGEIFKREWWRFYKNTPRIGLTDTVIQSWDMSFKDTHSSDYVVGQVWMRSGATRYLLDQVRGRMDFPATITAILSLSMKWQSARRKLIEDKANGPAVMQLLKSKLPGMIPVEPEGGKVVRARASTAEINAGNVYLPSPEIAPWVRGFIEECAAFPTGRYDDQVDAMTQAMIWFNQNDRQGDIPIEEATGSGGEHPGFDDDGFNGYMEF